MPETIVSKWFTFKARGHPNIRGTHRTTFEITRENYLTPRGDCIIGISSTASLKDLPQWLREGIRKAWTVIMVLCSGGVCDSVVGFGHPDLTLEDTVRIIVRRSMYRDNKTLMIKASKAARDLDRRLIRNLARGGELEVAVTVIPWPRNII